MANDERQAHDDDREEEEEAPFDEDPPVDPSVPRVGNSKARFVLPSEEEADASGPEGGGEGPRE